MVTIYIYVTSPSVSHVFEVFRCSRTSQSTGGVNNEAIGCVSKVVTCRLW